MITTTSSCLAWAGRKIRYVGHGWDDSWQDYLILRLDGYGMTVPLYGATPRTICARVLEAVIALSYGPH